jgi:hypothetical protein
MSDTVKMALKLLAACLICISVIAAAVFVMRRFF